MSLASLFSRLECSQLPGLDLILSTDVIPPLDVRTHRAVLVGAVGGAHNIPQTHPQHHLQGGGFIQMSSRKSCTRA